jgi:hypothetical protein
VGETNEAPAILGKKLRANEIERRGHVTAAIDIGMKLPLVVDQEPIDPIFSANEPKLLDRAWSHLLHPGNYPSTQPALPLHQGLLAEEKNSADDQSQKVKAKKKKRKIDGQTHNTFSGQRSAVSS